uniref:Dehydrogenase n=1 Tax=candidate division WOR-3 bacterium TaxID=2052148 RepID=A0A7V4E4S7_UNCW3
MKRSVCARDCYDTCFFKTLYEGGYLSFFPEKEHPITAGFLCYKGMHMSKWALSEERLKYPLLQVKKGSGQFQNLPWDSAFSIFKSALDNVIKEYGPEKVLVFEFAGTRGIINRFFPYRFFNKLNATFVRHNVCDSGGDEALKDVYGTSVGLSPEDVSNSELIVYWGMNPVKTNLHGYNYFRRRNFEIWVVDIRKSETAAPNFFIKIRPGTDIFLALLIAKILIDRKWYLEEFVLKNSIGFEEFKQYIGRFSFDYLAEKCGVDFSLAEDFARRFFEKRGIIHMGYGFQRSYEGPLSVAFISYLPFLVGNLPGFIYNMDVGLDKDYVKGFNLRTREPKFIYQSQLAEAIENDEVKFLFIYNANPLTTNPNVNRLKKAIVDKGVFVVTHDLFLTDTAMLSDLVFPAKSFFEYFDVLDSYYHKYVGINEKVFDGWGMSNYELMREFARYYGFIEPELFESEEGIITNVLKPARITFEELRRSGYVKVDRPFEIMTPSGKVEFISQRRKLRKVPDFPDLDEFKVWDKVDKDTLRLISVTYGNTISSQYHNTLRKVEKRIFINPEDAVKFDLEEGDEVSVFNENGQIFTTVHIDDTVPPGCAIMYKAFWKTIAGFTVNELTNDDVVEKFGYQAVYHSTYVKLKKRP